jgi:hypothetical protein
MSIAIIESKTEELITANQDLRESLQSIDLKVRTIGPSSPNAAQQLQALKDEKQNIVSAYNQKEQELLGDINSAKVVVQTTGNAEDQDKLLSLDVEISSIRGDSRANVRTVERTFNQKEEKIISGSNETNVDQTAKETEQKYEDSAGYNEETASLPDENQAGVDDDDTFRIEDKELVPNYGERIVPRVPKGAERFRTQNTKFVFRDVSGKKLGNDLRVKIRVPQNYWSKLTTGMDNELKELQGIIFPYTPSISTDFSADYSAVSPLHSNFPINFYQRSKISDISVAGKFTVENTSDAVIYLSTIHLLRALTRMRSGGKTGDSDSGSPPPVCRFDAYGEMMFKNVPVVIRSFKLELPESVDYFTIKGTDAYGPVSVPTVSTIAVTLTPMYSRNEMQKYSVTSYIQNIQFKKDGYL